MDVYDLDRIVSVYTKAKNTVRRSSKTMETASEYSTDYLIASIEFNAAMTVLNDLARHLHRV